MNIPVKWLRIRIIVYTLSFLLLILVYRGADRQTPQDAGRPTVVATEPPSQRTPAGRGGAPQADSVATVGRSSVTPAPAKALPRLGGLVDPTTLTLEQPQPAAPLAALLAAELAPTLLDPRSADVGEHSLATAWQMTGERVTVQLRAVLPLTAEQIAQQLREAAARGDLPLRGVEVVDGETLELRLPTNGCAAWLQVATWPLQATGEPAWQEAFGAGRFRLGAPARFEYRHFPDEASLLDAWQGSELDALLGASQLRSATAAGVRTAAPGPLLATLLFRLGDPLAGDPTVRQALTLATDRSALYEAAFGGPPEALLTALLPSTHWASPPESNMEPDVEGAVALLERAAWRDRDGDGTRENALGVPLRLTLSLPLSNDPAWERLGWLLAEQWARVGATVEPLYLESYSLQERLYTARWQVALVAYRVAAEPDSSAMWRAPAPDDLLANDLNITGYDAPAVGELMRQGAQVSGCTPAARAPFYHEAWAQLLRDRPLWPLFALPLDVLLPLNGGEPLP